MSNPMSPRRRRIPPPSISEDLKLTTELPVQREKVVTAYYKAIQALQLECFDYRVSEKCSPHCRFQSPGGVFCCKVDEKQLRACNIKFHITIVSLLAQALDLTEEQQLNHVIKRRLEVE